MQTSQNTTQSLTYIFYIHIYEAKKKQNQIFPLLPFNSVHHETDFITLLAENGIFKMTKYNAAHKFANALIATWASPDTAPKSRTSRAKSFQVLHRAGKGFSTTHRSGTAANLFEPFLSRVHYELILH